LRWISFIECSRKTKLTALYPKKERKKERKKRLYYKIFYNLDKSDVKFNLRIIDVTSTKDKVWQKSIYK
jgi:hypothetical protein